MTTYIKNSYVKNVTYARLTFLKIFVVDEVNKPVKVGVTLQKQVKMNVL